MTLFIDNLSLIFSGLAIYLIVYGLLLKTSIFEDKKLNSVIALMAAIITSLTGVVSFSLFYSFRLFAILSTIFFLIIVLIKFIGIDFAKIIEIKGVKYGVVAVIGIMFFLILLKSFFALNNSQLNNNQVNNSEINTSVNVGFEFGDFDLNVDEDTWDSFIFLLGLGIIVLIIGK